MCFEAVEFLVGKRGIEIGRHFELTDENAQAAALGLGRERHEAGHRPASAGYDDLFPRGGGIDEAGKLGFGSLDVDEGHGVKLFRKLVWGSTQ
jgi:hypothetical protein